MSWSESIEISHTENLKGMLPPSEGNTGWAAENYALRDILEKAVSKLPSVPLEFKQDAATSTLIDHILAQQKPTKQRKPSHRIRLASLSQILHARDLLPRMSDSGSSAMIVELGAGKALWGRLLYELCGQQTSTVVIDSAAKQHFRRGRKKDKDPGTYLRIVSQ